jgi:hypothetical protein
MPWLARTLPIAIAASAWLLAAPAAAKPPAKTHLGTTANDHVSLVTETSPIQPGVIAPLSFALSQSGGPPTPFTLPEGTALVVTDVSVSIPPSNAPPGRYTAGLCDTPCLFVRLPIEIDTAADGFQKTFALSGALVFRTLPQFDVLQTNGAGMFLLLEGYLLKAK